MPKKLGQDERKPLDLADFTRGAQSTQAGCGWLAIVLFLLVIALAAKTLLFK
jgi:hypothetical protein